MEEEEKEYRPASPRVKRAIAANDMTALAEALTTLQRRFAEEYILDFNKSAAAVRAGYATEYAERQGHVVHKNEGVQRYIEHLITTRRAEIMSVNPDYVLKQITSIISKESAKDADKLRGLEMLAKHLGMFIERQEITGKDGGAIEIQNQKVEEEAADFVNRMKALRDRTKKDVTLV